MALDSKAKEAMKIGKHIKELIDTLPEATKEKAPDFFSDVRAKAVDIRKTVRKRETASDKQIQALENMLAAVEKWDHGDDDEEDEDLMPLNQAQVEACPHCGGEARATYCAYFQIECRRCKIHTANLQTFEEALFLWNRRRETIEPYDYADLGRFLERTGYRHAVSEVSDEVKTYWERSGRDGLPCRQVRIWCPSTHHTGKDDVTSVWTFDSAGKLLEVKSFMP